VRIAALPVTAPTGVIWYVWLTDSPSGSIAVTFSSNPAKMRGTRPEKVRLLVLDRSQDGSRRPSSKVAVRVTADIRTGERGVLEYLLDPLLRYRQESLRER